MQSWINVGQRSKSGASWGLNAPHIWLSFPSSGLAFPDLVLGPIQFSRFGKRQLQRLPFMIKRLLSYFRGTPVTIPNSHELLEGTSRMITVGDILAGGRMIMLSRIDGVIYAMDAECPHEQGEMERGPLAEGKYLVCPAHNFQFDPKTGDVVKGHCRKAITFKVVEKDGVATLYY